MASNVKALESQILQEQRGRKRPAENGFYEDSQNPTAGPSGYRFGPCIWCGGQGHMYKSCRQWKVKESMDIDGLKLLGK